MCGGMEEGFEGYQRSRARIGVAGKRIVTRGREVLKLRSRPQWADWLFRYFRMVREALFRCSSSTLMATSTDLSLAASTKAI